MHEPIQPDWVKPALGIMPRHIWLEKRAFDLAGAITRSLETSPPASEYRTLPITWANELLDTLCEIEKLYERRAAEINGQLVRSNK